MKIKFIWQAYPDGCVVLEKGERVVTSNGAVPREGEFVELYFSRSAKSFNKHQVEFLNDNDIPIDENVRDRTIHFFGMFKCHAPVWKETGDVVIQLSPHSINKRGYG